MRSFALDDLKKDIWIWGTGNIAGKAMAACLSTANIKGIIDNDIQKQGRVYFGHKVVSMDTAAKSLMKEDVIVICCREEYAAEIEKQLKGHGCKNEYCLFEEMQNEKIYCYSVSKYLFGNCTESGYEEKLISRCCTEQDFERADFKWAAAQLKLDIEKRRHRKVWEWLYIINVLNQHEELKKGMKGIGFAVGTEPLPSYFASRSITVLATDLNPVNENAAEWIATNQNAGGDIEKLYHKEICNREDFEKYLTFRYIDMNFIPDDLKDFDFCWSSCAVEHVGSLDKAKECVKNMLKVLKPGGIAINTTEFNLSSNLETCETGASVIFRRKDIEELAQWCKENGHSMEISFKRGDWMGDRYIDIPPYDIYTKYHLNLMLEKYVSTSFAIVITKGS